MELNNFNNIFLLLLPVVIILFLNFTRKSSDNFTNLNTEDSLDLMEAIKTIEGPSHFNYSIIKMDEAIGKIVKKALLDNDLKKKIKDKMFLIYNKIQANDELKTYLKFINLINEDGLPIFINESESVVLANEVKIILITNKSYEI